MQVMSLVGDRRPWEGRALQAQLGSPAESQRKRALPPPQRAGGPRRQW